jgi:hypothetical protein
VGEYLRPCTSEAGLPAVEHESARSPNWRHLEIYGLAPCAGDIPKPDSLTGGDLPPERKSSRPAHTPSRAHGPTYSGQTDSLSGVAILYLVDRSSQMGVRVDTV